MTTTRAIQIARHLIHIAAAVSEPDWLNPLRLQKLLYYVQGWSLGLRGKPMFADRIEAWVHGPVVPNVWRVYQGYESIKPEGVPKSNLDEDDAEFIDAVWQAYRRHSATSLREMTHREEPWIKARGTCGPVELCDEEITHESMKSFFRKATKKK